MSTAVDLHREVAGRVARLRTLMADIGLDGFIVPRADEHQGEYVPPSAERLSWLSGFTGSAGMAIVLRERAAIFTDGRYILQVRDEVPANVFEHCHGVKQPVSEWLFAALNDGDKLGFDPKLTTPGQVACYRQAAGCAGACLIAVAENLVDCVWPDRPARPTAPIVPHGMTFTGRSSSAKCRSVAGKIRAEGQAAMVIAAPDCIAWLLNVRGGDLAYTPQPLSFAILHDGGRVDWFVEPSKPSDGLAAHLNSDVVCHPPDAFAASLTALGAAGKTVRIDPDSASEWIRKTLAEAGARLVFGPDFCLAERAVKTEAEIQGMRNAHVRDGAALVRFLAWLDAEAPGGAVSEIVAADYLEGCRRGEAYFRGLSFSTISGAGPNGAIVHYRVTSATDRVLGNGELYLVDSGAQYLDGTTDVTRTVPIGVPGDDMRDAFTRVLKGHIAIADARFPAGINGSQLDPFARRHLWEAGLDYDHGTGHGVGSYLGVHEGPQRIAKAAGAVPLQAGMVVSNEPGYYKTGAFGIRIENLVLVKQLEPPQGAEQALLGFETLTLAPIDRRLIVVDMLEDRERAWLDAYHLRVRETLSGALDSGVADWLATATEPLGTG